MDAASINQFMLYITDEDRLLTIAQWISEYQGTPNFRKYTFLRSTRYIKMGAKELSTFKMLNPTQAMVDEYYGRATMIPEEWITHLLWKPYIIKDFAKGMTVHMYEQKQLMDAVLGKNNNNTGNNKQSKNIIYDMGGHDIVKHHVYFKGEGNTYNITADVDCRAGHRSNMPYSAGIADCTPGHTVSAVHHGTQSTSVAPVIRVPSITVNAPQRWRGAGNRGRASSKDISIGTIRDTPLLINTTGNTVNMGVSAITDSTLRTIIGNYEPVRSIPRGGIILRLQQIEKSSGYRLICTSSRKQLEQRGILNDPALSDTDAHLDIKRTLMRLCYYISEFKYSLGSGYSDNGVAIISVDVSNAYARIYCPGSNIYMLTSDGKPWHIRQPIQGSSIAGTVAPNCLFKYYLRINRLLRQEFGKGYMGHASYSDNGLFVVDFNIRDKVRRYIENVMTGVYNHEQAQTAYNGGSSIRVLGFKFKVQRGKVKISIPETARKQSASFYAYIIGHDVSYIWVHTGRPLQIHCDGIGNSQGGIASAVVIQSGEQQPIMGLSKVRSNIDQSLSESLGVLLASLLTSYTNDRVPIYTDSMGLINIMDNIREYRKNRLSLESKVLVDLDQLMIKYIPSSFNQADAFTRSNWRFLRVRHPRDVRQPRPDKEARLRRIRESNLPPPTDNTGDETKITDVGNEEGQINGSAVELHSGDGLVTTDLEVIPRRQMRQKRLIERILGEDLELSKRYKFGNEA